jgi:hypothetical protein
MSGGSSGVWVWDRRNLVGTQPARALSQGLGVGEGALDGPPVGRQQMVMDWSGLLADDGYSGVVPELIANLLHHSCAAVLHRQDRKLALTLDQGGEDGGEGRQPDRSGAGEEPARSLIRVGSRFPLVSDHVLHQPILAPAGPPGDTSLGPALDCPP